MLFRIVVWFVVLITMNLNATNYNLSHAKYLVMEKYKAEAFLAKRIYIAEEGSREYFTLTKSAYLIEYISDNQTGLNAGLYSLKDDSDDSFRRYIIAFGGTTAYNNKESTDLQSVDKLGDVIADLNLLNSRKEVVIQPAQAKAFTEYFIKMHELKKKDITLTGHSLGGGLVQYVSHRVGISGITFNTAPYPIYDRIGYSNRISNPDIDVINIMSSEDELTGTLMYLENLENLSTGKDTHNGEMFTLVTAMIKDLIANLKIKGVDVFPDEATANLGISLASKFGAILSTKIISLEAKEILVNNYQNKKYVTLASNLRNLLNLTIKDKDYKETEQYYKTALTALMNDNIPQFIINIKLAFKIEIISLQNLFFGKRIVLPTGTHHGMLELVEKSYYDFSTFTTNDAWENHKQAIINEYYTDKLEKLDKSEYISLPYMLRDYTDTASLPTVAFIMKHMYQRITDLDNNDYDYKDFIADLGLKNTELADRLNDYPIRGNISYKEYMLIAEAMYKKLFGGPSFFSNLRRNNKSYLIYDAKRAQYASEEMNKIYGHIFLLHFMAGTPKKYLQNDSQDISNSFVINFLDRFLDVVIRYRSKII